ncbi:MAG: AAA family ATPase [Candidatus Heritagella sp.]
MSNRIITISRQFGSGGRTIGKQLSAKLGIPCYDSQLLEKIADQSGFAKEYIAERGEYAAGGTWFSQAFSGRDYQGHSYQDDLWVLQQKIITELAEKEPCVIVGRCADYILRGKADCLRVFIYSDMESRARRIVEQYGERSDSPEKRLRDKDKRRAAYYQFYTDGKWGDMQNYDLALNSGALGIESCVEILANLYRKEKEE